MPATLKRTLSYYPGRGQARPTKAARTARRRTPFYRSLVSKGVVSKTRMVTMNYYEQVEINPDSFGTAAHYYFRANSIFDPNYTGTGHQPYGHDIMGTLYKRYCVMGAKIRVDFISAAPGDDGSALVGVRLDSDNVGSPDSREVIESPDTVYKLVSDADSGPAIATVYKSFSAKRDFGINPTLQNQGNIGAEFGINPAHMQYFDVFAAPSGNAADPSAISVHVFIQYRVLLSEPLDLNVS